MKIGFDAKRAFHNNTGLGNYSRTLISSLVQCYPQNDYYLFNPRPSRHYSFENMGNHLHEVVPAGFISSLAPSLWRSRFILKEIKLNNIELYHGLSHEIPFGLSKTGIKSIVTIHDLIHKRYPQQFGPINAFLYNLKSRYACENADKIIAISHQTKRDIIEYYKVPPGKIVVCYQGCNPSFAKEVTDEEKEVVRARYHLPKQFYLFVGSVIERKNLLLICKALAILRSSQNIPLIVIGDGRKYKAEVKRYLVRANLTGAVIFLADEPAISEMSTYQNGEDFPAIFACATALVYPSVFEGFGIPILEALFSKLPVIAAATSSLPEAGGDAALYIKNNEAEELATAMQKVATDADLRLSMKEKGWRYAQNFTTQKCAESVMVVYKSVLITGANG